MDVAGHGIAGVDLDVVGFVRVLHAAEDRADDFVLELLPLVFCVAKAPKARRNATIANVVFDA
eukprot:2211582-Prorocentrum_lima.AAC.1